MIGRFPLNIVIPKYVSASFNNPIGVAYNANDNIIGIANYGNKVVQFLNADTFEVVHSMTITTSQDQIAALEYDSLNNRYFLGYENNGNKIGIINGSDYSITTIPFSLDHVPVTRGFQFDYANDRMFISAYRTNDVGKIYVYKISDLSYISDFTVSQSTGISLDNANSKLYVACHSSGEVRVYDSNTFVLLNTITGFNLAYSVYQDPDISNRLLVCDYSANELVLLDKDTNSIIGRLKNIANPRYSVIVNNEIITTSATNKLFVQPRFYSVSNSIPEVPPSEYDVDYQAVLDYAESNSIAIPDDAQKNIDNDLIIAYKATGAWSKRDCFFKFKGTANDEFKLICWKRRIKAVKVGVITFDTLGAKGNGTSSYIDPLFDLINSNAYTLNSAGVDWVEVEQGAANGGAIVGVYVGNTSEYLLITPRQAATTGYAVLNGYTAASSNYGKLGYIAVNRVSSSSININNGAAVLAHNSITKVSKPVFIFARNRVDTSSTDRHYNGKISFFSIGASVLSEHDAIKSILE